MTNKKLNNEAQESFADIRAAQIRQSKRISPFWLLPLVALLIGAILFFQIIKEQGHSIKIPAVKAWWPIKPKFVIKVYKSAW